MIREMGNFIARNWVRWIPLPVRRVILLIFWMAFLLIVPLEILALIQSGG